MGTDVDLSQCTWPRTELLPLWTKITKTKQQATHGLWRSAAMSAI